MSKQSTQCLGQQGFDRRLGAAVLTHLTEVSKMVGFSREILVKWMMTGGSPTKTAVLHMEVSQIIHFRLGFLHYKPTILDISRNGYPHFGKLENSVFLSWLPKWWTDAIIDAIQDS